MSDRYKYSDYMLAMAAGLLATALAAGNSHVRLAMAWSDDTPVVFSHFLEHPQFWRGDDLATYGATYGHGTVLNWGTALLERWSGISAVTVSVVLIYLQNAVFALGCFAYARALTASRYIAVTTTLFALGAQPWAWNLALYQPATDSPYAGHFVLGLILLAAAAYLHGRVKSAAVTLGVAALVHPMLALLGTTLLVLAALRESRRLSAAFVFLLPMTLAIALPFAVRGASSGVLSGVELLAALRANKHMYPVANDAFWYERLPSFTGFLVVCGLAWKSVMLAPRAHSFLVACAAGIAVWITTHVAAWLIELPILIQLNGHRASIVAVLFGLPLVMSYLLARGVDHARRAAAAVLLALQSMFTMGLYVGPLAALFAAKRHQRGAFVILSMWLVLLLVFGTIGAASDATTARPVLALLAPGVYFAPVFFVVAVAMAATLFAGRMQQRVVLIVLCVAFVVRSIDRRREIGQRNGREIYALQSWAHAHSAPGDVFVIEPPISFRTFALRRAVMIDGPHFEVYSRSRVSVSTRDSIEAFIARNPENWKAFSQRFGGRYLVRESNKMPGGTLVYSNRAYAVYRIE